MDHLEAYLRAAETAAGAAYHAVSGTYQQVDAWTKDHPAIRGVVPLAETLLKALGIDIAPTVDMAALIWGRLGLLLAADPTVQGPALVQRDAGAQAAA